MDKVISFKKDVKILENLPLVLNTIKEIEALANVEDPILSAEWGLIDAMVDNQFVLTADEDGLTRYEEMLKLKRKLTDPLEERRLAILARYQEKAPYTWIVLNRMLDTLLGVDNYTVVRDVANKVLTVRLKERIYPNIAIILEMLERITPQDLILIVEFYYNTHEYLSQFTHEQLAFYTHTQLREEELDPPVIIHNDYDYLKGFTNNYLNYYNHIQLESEEL